MRKIHILGAALMALLACSALATSASALTFELALWLLNGNDVAGEVLTKSEGEILFENLLNGAHFTCSGVFEGTVNTNSAGTVTMVYALGTGGRLIEELAGEALLCKEENCEKPEIWPIGLPWKTELEQDSEDVPATFWVLTTGAAYHFSCSVFGIKVEELCEQPAGSANEVLNVTGGVEAMGSVSPEANCGSNASEGEATFVAGNLTSPVNGGTLAASLNANKE